MLPKKTLTLLVGKCFAIQISHLTWWAWVALHKYESHAELPWCQEALIIPPCTLSRIFLSLHVDCHISHKLHLSFFIRTWQSAIQYHEHCKVVTAASITRLYCRKNELAIKVNVSTLHVCMYIFMFNAWNCVQKNGILGKSMCSFSDKVN